MRELKLEVENKFVKKINPLVRASVFYILGNGVGQGIILLSAIVFTRVMSREDYGNYSTYYSIVSIFTTLVGANLFTGLSNAYIDYKEDIKKYRASNLILSSFVFSIVCVVSIVINWVLGNRISMFLLIMSLVHAYGFFVINYFNYSANMENRYKIKTVFMVFPNILQVFFSVAFICVFPFDSLYSRVIGSVLGILVCATYLYIVMMQKQKGLVVWEYWKYGLKISIPSVFSSISYMLMSQFDNIMITSFWGAEETAVYALVYNIGYILYAVMQATNGVLQVWLYRSLDSGEVKGVRNIQKWYLYVFAQMGIGLYMISPEVIKLLSPVNYWSFEYIVPFIIGSSMMVIYSFYYTLGLFYKKSFAVSVRVCLAAVLNIVLNAVFIPVYGGIAAAYTSAMSYFVLFLMLRRLGQGLNRDFFELKYFVVYIFAMILFGIVFMLIYSNILLRYIVYMIVLLISLFYMYYRKEELAKIIGKG